MVQYFYLIFSTGIESELLSIFSYKLYKNIAFNVKKTGPKILNFQRFDLYKGKIIPQLSILKQDLVILKMKKCLHYLKFHQKLIKQSDLIFIISCMFDLLLDTCFWTFLNVQTGIAQKLPNQLFSGLVHSKGFLKKHYEQLTKPQRHFCKLLAHLNPVWGR